MVPRCSCCGHSLQDAPELVRNELDASKVRPIRPGVDVDMPEEIEGLMWPSKRPSIKLFVDVDEWDEQERRWVKTAVNVHFIREIRTTQHRVLEESGERELMVLLFRDDEFIKVSRESADIVRNAEL